MRGASDVPLNAAAKTSRRATTSALSNAPSGVERRRATRVRSQSLLNGGIDGAAEGASASFLGTTVDLSMGGCLFRTYETLDPGTSVTITLKLPEGDLKTPGQIVRVSEDAVGCRMCGLKFAPLTAASQALLSRHISRFSGAEPPAAGSPPTAGSNMERPASERSNRKVVVEGLRRRD